MRIVVISDTHNDFAVLHSVVQAQPKADMFIHLGDGEREAADISDIYPELKFYTVRGNGDFASQSPIENEMIVCDKRVFFTHGHNYYVKSGISALVSKAKQNKADIALFGHTHIPITLYDDGLYIMNPGSLGHPYDGRPTYGIVDISKAGIVLNIVKYRY